MSQVFTVEPNPLLKSLPMGAISCGLLGDILASRLSFNGQRMTRRRKLIDSTPDHLTFQYYHSGGFSGEIAQQPVKIRRGLVVITDLRYPIDAHAVSSNTAGLSIPRSALFEKYSRKPMPVLDQSSNRLLGAQIVALHRKINNGPESGVGCEVQKTLEFMRRILNDPGVKDVLDCEASDLGVRELAERLIQMEIGASSLSPSYIAEKIGSSRATLYRAFAPEGVMMYIRQQRLQAVDDRIKDPTERRSLSQIAGDHGFNSLTVLGRLYHDKFGISPREARATAQKSARTRTTNDFHTHERWWNRLGS